MSQWSESKLPARQNLSSLMDGELEPPSLAETLRLWREDPELRDAWHAYSLVGDVLRSDELASEASHDAAFLANFRTRLAREPVVLAPIEAVASLKVSSSAPHRRGWIGMTAVAAGFLTVAGVVTVLQMRDGAPSPGNAPQGALLAAAPNAGASLVLASEGAASGSFNDPQHIVVNGQLIRDARLDEYLAAHKKFGGSSLPGGPSGLMRSAAVDGVAR